MRKLWNRLTRAGRRRRRQREADRQAQLSKPHKFGQFHIPPRTRVTRFDIFEHDTGA